MRMARQETDKECLSILPSFRLLTLFLFTLYIIGPTEGVALPSWYRFYVEKLSIALPLLFILIGYSFGRDWDMPNSSLHYLRKNLILACKVALSYILLSFVSWLLPQLTFLSSYFSSESSFWHQLIYPQRQFFSFQSFVPTLVVLILLSIPLSKQTLPYFTRIVALGIACLASLIANALLHEGSNSICLLGFDKGISYFFYFFWGAILYHTRNLLIEKKNRILLLLLFHAVLFTRIFAPLSTDVLRFLNPLYNALLAAVYTLLASRMRPLTKKLFLQSLSTYTIEAGTLVIVLAYLLRCLFFSTPTNPWLLGTIILFLFFFLLLFVSILIYFLECIFRKKS